MAHGLQLAPGRAASFTPSVVVQGLWSKQMTVFARLFCVAGSQDEAAAKGGAAAASSGAVAQVCTCGTPDTPY